MKSLLCIVTFLTTFWFFGKDRRTFRILPTRSSPSNLYQAVLRRQALGLHLDRFSEPMHHLISFCTGYDLRLLMWFSSSQQAQACRWEMGSLKFAMGLSLLSYESCRHASFFDLSKTLGRFLSFFSGSFKVFHCRLFSEVPPVFQLPKSFAFFNQILISGHWILFFPFNLFQISLLFVFLLLF